MSRRLPAAFAAGWLLLAGWSAAARAGRLVRAVPTIRTGAAERAALESGDPGYHRFLLTVRAALRPGESAALWIEDPAGEASYVLYRARYELFPFPVVVLPGPRRGPIPPGASVLGEYRRGDPSGRVRRR